MLGALGLSARSTWAEAVRALPLLTDLASVSGLAERQSARQSLGRLLLGSSQPR